jgi:isoamylase
MLGAFANRIAGSADIYTKSGKSPKSSINFITCHDGFTLNDLVGYQHKHNEANGENNSDGTNNNLSENYGVEGETTDSRIESIRKRQIKNFLLTLFISRGVPMLLGGDEFRRTQRGNNNAYCQDNAISWYDWNYLTQQQEIFLFTRAMIAFRQAHPVLSKEQFYTDTEIHWFSSHGGLPNWEDPQEKQLACLIWESEQIGLYLMFNTGADAVDFDLPRMANGACWYLAADTSRNNPLDCFANGKEPRLDNSQVYHMAEHASAILVTHKAQVVTQTNLVN